MSKQIVGPVARTRITTATARRVENMKSLIARMHGIEMTLPDICVVLGFSLSGARKYTQELRDAGVIEIARYVDGTDAHIGKPSFRLTNPDRATAFLEAIRQPGPPGRIVKAPPVPPAGRLHIMDDDANYAVRVDRGPVVRDWLVAAFFGPGPTPRQKASILG